MMKFIENQLPLTIIWTLCIVGYIAVFSVVFFS